MIKLLAVLAAALILAYISEQNTKAVLASGRRYFIWNDWAYILLVILLTFFAGLRTHYNDTSTYMNSFRTFPLPEEWLADADSYNIFKNPLFYFLQSLLRSATGNPQWLIFLSAFITQMMFLRFFKRYSGNFCFSVYIYFTLGTFLFTMAALKQVLAMAILTMAFPCLEKNQWGKYYLIVFIAMLVHTYAMSFAVLPLLRGRPWKVSTLLVVAATAVLMMNFRDAITAFMDQANDLGKTLAEYEVFDDNTINGFRLAVYAVPPLISLVFQRWVSHNNSEMENIMIQMSIVSLAFMSMGTQSGANMFARMATYFELGTICILPRMIDKTFDKRSGRLVSGIAVACFFGFFLYANFIGGDFETKFKWIFS